MVKDILCLAVVISWGIQCMEIDSLISHNSLEEMAYHYKSGREKSLIPFERIYSLPLQISDKNSNRYTTTVSQAIQKLTRTDYSELKVHNKKVTDELSASLLWNFMQLPATIQMNIVSLMMEKNKTATDLFVHAPFWYAIDRLIRIRMTVYHNRFEAYREPSFCRIPTAVECCRCIACLGGGMALTLLTSGCCVAFGGYFKCVAGGSYDVFVSGAATGTVGLLMGISVPLCMENGICLKNSTSTSVDIS
jgi:hypothetical protein